MRAPRAAALIIIHQTRFDRRMRDLYYRQQSAPSCNSKQARLIARSASNPPTISNRDSRDTYTRIIIRTLTAREHGGL
jgi:hypothetical protein